MKQNSIEKSLIILLSFTKEKPKWGVRELATLLGFSPATVQRILQTLKAYHFVDQELATKQYTLGNVYYRFLHTLQSNQPISQIATPFMRELTQKTQETVHLNVIDGNERICIDTIESPQALKASMPIGSRSPLYAGASSKCLLAFSDEAFITGYLKEMTPFLPITDKTIISPQDLRKELDRIKKRGFAESLGERNIGLGSISAPIFNHQGTLVAGISLAVPEIRYKDTPHHTFCTKEITIIAEKISRKMGRI